jgi:DNA-binding MarR family transcriptional regulator
MIAVDVVAAVRDPGDARRRMLDLTPRGRNMSNELFAIWKEFGEAQKRRFTAAGCDIMEVMRKVEDSIEERSLSSEVLQRIAKKSEKPKRSATLRRAARVSMFLLAAAAIIGTAVEAQTPQIRSPQSQQMATPIDAAAKAALVSALSDSLINGYIYEKTGRALADSLRAELSSGAYNGFDTGESFAQRVNQTLKRIANDRHLGVQYAPVSTEPQRMRVRVPPGGMPSSVAPNPSDPNTIIFRE